MRGFKVRPIIFLAIFLCASFVYGKEWERLDKFQSGAGIYSLKTFESGENDVYSVTRKTNVMVIIRGRETLSVDITGIASLVSYRFKNVDSYNAYKQKFAPEVFDDQEMTFEESLDPKSFDKRYSYGDFLELMNDGFQIFASENYGYKFYKKVYDPDLDCKIERTCLLELLVLNLADYIDASVTPPLEDIRWTRTKDFKPVAGTYDVTMTTSGTDSESGISADSEMSGRLVIRGVNSYSRVTIEVLSGSVLMHFAPETYNEAKSLYKMAYGDTYNYDDDKMTISGHLDYDSLSQFSSAMTYKDFLEMGSGELYSDENGAYKIVTGPKSDGSMKYDMTMVFEKMP